MMWIYIAGLVFACTTVNHLGLVSAVEEVIGIELPIVNCVRCFTFWTVFIYLLTTTHDVIMSPAIALLASYIAIWLELLEGFIDTLHTRIYDTIYPTDDDTSSADDDKGDTENAMSELRQITGK